MIPEIDVRRQIATKEYEGKLSFDFEGEGDLLGIPYVAFAGPVRAEFSFCIAADNQTVSLSGELVFTLEGSCSRCLEDASKDFCFQTDAVFLPGEGDGEAYGYTNGRVRLEEFLRDSLMFALPSRLLCKTCERWENEE